MLNNLSHWMKHILSIVLAASLSSPLHAQTEVTPYQPGITPDGITYFLPQTRLCVVVKATRKHFEPGEFADYAQRFMRLADAGMLKEDMCEKIYMASVSSVFAGDDVKQQLWGKWASLFVV